MDDTPKQQKQDKKAHRIAFWVTLSLLLFSVALTTYSLRNLRRAPLQLDKIIVLTLFNVDIILAVLLLLLLSRNLIKLYFERRHKILGAVFRTKLIAAFLGFSLIPTILLFIFIIGSGYLTNSIDNWFSVRAERPLVTSLEVAQHYRQSYHDLVLRAAEDISRGMTERRLLQEENQAPLVDFLTEKQAVYRLDGVKVLATDSRLIATARGSSSQDHHDGSLSQMIKKAEKGEKVIATQHTNAGDLIRGVLPLFDADETGKVDAFVLVDSSIPPHIMAKIQEITQAYEDYNKTKKFQRPFKQIYLLALLIITLVILFSATWFGFYLGKGITIPIQKLAEGTQAVAQGNLHFTIDVQAADEIGLLVTSFNKMTDDLRKGKSQLEKANLSLRESNAESERRRMYIETVLESIAAGVISIDREGRIRTFNRSSEKILNTKAGTVKGKVYGEALKTLHMEILLDLIDQLKDEGKTSLEKEIQIEVNKKNLTLRLILSALTDGEGNYLGTVVVFDDLSELMRAQKAATWQEVARRIAHEIKNPLTPIQLSAQRLRKKYFAKSQDLDEIFDNSTSTIIREVNSLKTLVDEFSAFARMPSPQPRPCDLHDILREVVLLYEGAHKDIIIVQEMNGRLPTLHLDRDQIKRVFMNLFENAIEAMKKKGRLWISTMYDQDKKTVMVEIADEGRGIHPEDMDKLFLPYFSRKKTGSGLGLAIVNRIISDHNGHITVTPHHPKGTRFIIELPADGKEEIQWEKASSL